ncbi:MAG: dTDP-4-dehydrorhamnose reductase [candidate division Zixibacteria bacterium]|nr:dTDP-4-dehydrorhamnose reductase [candidate division Zixibacteria bacterium]
MSKIIITGVCGLLGQKLVKSLKGNHIIGFDLLDEHPDPRARIEYRRTDIADQDDLVNALHAEEVDCIINCASVTDVDGCEKNTGLAYMVNVKGVENLADICKAKNIRLIQLSTDYIFDGKDGPYTERDKPNPLGYYGTTKLNAEKYIIDNLKDYIIVRTNVLYGVGSDTKPNFVSWLLGKLQEDKHVNIVTDQYNNPTLADNLADAIAELVDTDFRGVLNFGGSDYLSRYRFAGLIARAFDLNEDLIQPALSEELSQLAKRPARGGLRNDKARKLLKTNPLSIKEGLKIFKNQYEFLPADQT